MFLNLSKRVPLQMNLNAFFFSIGRLKILELFRTKLKSKPNNKMYLYIKLAYKIKWYKSSFHTIEGSINWLESGPLIRDE